MADQKQVARTVRSLRNGQITIPAEFRRALGITPDSLLQMRVEGEELRIRKVRATPDTTGSPWLAELYRRFAPIRQEAVDQGYTEDEIDDAIDTALAAVRRRDA